MSVYYVASCQSRLPHRARDRRLAVSSCSTRPSGRSRAKAIAAAAISDIVARADVARGTFYLYFDSKEQIFLAIVEDFHDRIRRMLEEPDPPVRLAEHNGRAVLQRSFRRWLVFFAAHRDAAAVILKEATSIDPRFEASLARAPRAGARRLRRPVPARAGARPRQSLDVSGSRGASADGDARRAWSTPSFSATRRSTSRRWRSSLPPSPGTASTPSP